MTFTITQVHAIFSAAVELSSPQERAEFIELICGDNAELRKRVEELVAAHFEAGNFLESPLATALYNNNDYIEASPGTVIGPYKLLQQIGEGGMGVVFMAEQTEPIQRTVALKIIKPGMDTRQVIARFEAERQAVAMMDHPNIAKVLDAGTTDSGRPYFVMELVKGVPITKYCDEKHLPLRERLELFMQVCQAVQHAHQKGIIHRDIKPNNVLVAEYDDHAVPKVIDFGVAKATAQKLTERTMFTEFGQVIGTMEYMSPEQGEVQPARHRHPQRHLFAGRAALRAAGRHQRRLRENGCTRRRSTKCCGSFARRSRPSPARGSARAATRSIDRRQSADRAGPLEQRRARRAGLDRDEVPGEGPQPPLRDGERLRRRHRAPSARRAGGGRSAVGGVPLPQVRPASRGSIHRFDRNGFWD